ncbi:MAG: oligoendopeptidase F, partial [Vallitaleaceae bacterium]|nr:oligoendopeptidase F [Vallitaleaceae bacterium]
MSNESAVKMLPLRSEIKVEDTWRLEDIFGSDALWESEFESVKGSIAGISAMEGTLGLSSEQLYQALKFQDEIGNRLSILYTYAHMRYDQDTTNAHYQGLNDRVKGLHTQVLSGLSFLLPEILSIDEQRVVEFLQENEALKLYKHVIERINLQRPHVLRADQEALLAMASDVLDASSNTFGMLNNADLEFPSIEDEKGEKVAVTHGRYIRFLESEDQRVRRDAFKVVYDTYGKYRNTFASTLSSNVKKDNFYGAVRKYESARQAALAENNIPEAVYDQLVQTINGHLPLLHRYVKLRKKVLGLSELHIYDLYTPLVKNIKMEIEYEEAKGIILKALAPLGQEYLNVLQTGFSERWVDVHENKGKRSGAYSSGTYGTSPYILMNWQNNVNNLFTLAHEFGHSVHSYYTRKNQPLPYGDYSIFVAEVASTCNEALVNHYLLNTIEDDQKRLYLLNHYLEGFRGTV